MKTVAAPRPRDAVAGLFQPRVPSPQSLPRLPFLHYTTDFDPIPARFPGTPHERSLFSASLRRADRRQPLRQRHAKSTSSRRSSGPSGRPWPSTPSGSWSISASARTTRWPPPVGPPRDGRRDRQAREPRLRRQRHRRLQGGGGPASCSASSRCELDPVTEINHCIGTKTALAMLPAAFINPGDVTLMTVPGYPVAGTHTKYYGGEVHRLPLRAENDFLPDLDAIPAEICRRAKLLVLNYPNSPTGTRGHAGVLRPSDRVRPAERGGRRPGRGPRDAQLRRVGR